MAWLKDLQRSKVYAAEDEEFYQRAGAFETQSEWAAFCKKLFVGLPDVFGNPKAPTVVEGTSRPRTAALAFPDYGTWKILIARNEPKFKIHATHEASHLLSYRWHELNGLDCEPHGSIFTAIHLYLLWKHVDKGISIQMRQSYSSHGVRVAKFSDL